MNYYTFIELNLQDIYGLFFMYFSIYSIDAANIFLRPVNQYHEYDQMPLIQALIDIPIHTPGKPTPTSSDDRK